MKNQNRGCGGLRSFTIGLALALVALPGLSQALTPTPPGPDGDMDMARRLENAFVKVAEQASKSVVVITSSRSIEAKAGSPGGEELGEQFEGTPFEFFFRRLPRGHPRHVDSQGSGIILRPDGYIVTNKHVVEGTDKITVRLKDGRQYEAKIVGVDERTDIAVIKVDAKDLPAATLGNSDEVKVGQWAIAIGAPYELDYSFTVGFVSATGRWGLMTRGGSAYEDYIQTDAAINPGNSGGPLCDIEGRVIGMNTLIRGLNRGLGFAIPINMTREIANQLIDKGKIIRPWLGIGIQSLADHKELAEMLKEFNIKDGVVVQEIHADTPAAASDLKPADVIVAVDGAVVKSPRDLQQQILRKQVGQTVTLDVARDGKRIQVSLQTGEMPDPLQLASRQLPGKPTAETAYGLTVQTLTKELSEQLNLEPTEGVVVTDVADGSVAQEKGLQQGDVVTEVNRSPVRSAEQFKAAVDKADPKKGALLYVKRNDTSTFVVLKDSK